MYAASHAQPKNDSKSNLSWCMKVAARLRSMRIVTGGSTIHVRSQARSREASKAATAVPQKPAPRKAALSSGVMVQANQSSVSPARTKARKPPNTVSPDATR